MSATISQVSVNSPSVEPGLLARSYAAVRAIGAAAVRDVERVLEDEAAALRDLGAWERENPMLAKLGRLMLAQFEMVLASKGLPAAQMTETAGELLHVVATVAAATPAL